MSSLHQSETWTTREGLTIRLEDMTVFHRQNLMRFLDRRADALKEREELWLCAVDGPNGDVSSDIFDQEFDRLLKMPSVEWLHGTALYRRLAELNRP